MRQFSFSLANQEDDAQMRALIRATPMEGKISVAFQREPNYFHAARTEGRFNQTIVAREFENGHIIGMGSRSVKPAFVNGEVASLGYLSSLRIHEDYRHHTLLSRGYQALKNLHADHKVKAYISTIIYDNARAISLLTAGRDGLPKYNDFGVYNTYVVKLGRPIRAKSKRVDIVRGSEQNLNEIVRCLQRNGRDKQFYPYYEVRDFEPRSEFLRDFKKEDFYVAIKDSRIVGVLGKWDQRTFKQVVICGYGRTMSGIRPVYNYLADLVNRPTLPSPQSALASFCISFIAVDDNDPEIFSTLLKTVYNDHLSSEYECMVVGLYEQDPLAGVAERYPHIKYKSRVFVVCWEDGMGWLNALDSRTPYLEVAAL